MNVLYLGLTTIESLSEHDMYIDLLRVLSNKGHTVYCVSCLERRKQRATECIYEGNNGLLHVKTLNIQKTGLLEKGLATLLITGQYKRAIKKFFKDVKFDLVLYPTPPITLYGVVKYFKKRDNARTYLMLKDIFPQNAVDLGLISKNGLKGIIYKYFRNKEKKLYAVSDRIGCMSPANVTYLTYHNPDVNGDKVEVFPNCIEPQDISLTKEQKEAIKTKYGLPLDKKIFVYGGNLGKPQDIPFVIECLKTQKENNDAFFFVVGDGTGYKLLEDYQETSKQENFKLMKRLSRDDFEIMIASCDVGLIFLDYRFTIPNFPSRILSYLQGGLPILACTDKSSDMGKVIENNKLGWSCNSNDPDQFMNIVNDISKKDLSSYRSTCVSFLRKEYSVEKYIKQLESF